VSDDDIELRHLRSFVAVATQLNFSRAADELHLTQQSLSAQIRQLERRLGAELLHRTTRRVELTHVGAVFLEQASAILADVATGLARVRRAAVGDLGRLTVAFTPTIATETLPALLAEVAEHAPELTLRVSEMWQAESVEAVRAGRLDAGLARHPELPPELDSITIRNEPFGAVVGAVHPLAGREVLRAAELSDLKLAIWPRDFSPAFFDRVIASYRADGFHGDITEMSLLTRGSFLQDPAAHRMIEAGEAFSVAFEHQHDPMPEGFVWRPVENAPVIGVHLFWRRPSTPAIHRLVQLARQLAARRAWL
jgi:DNA-binding transcriptional LysR family regulator